MYIDTTGTVGIGTTSPQTLGGHGAILNQYNSNATALIQQTSSSAGNGSIISTVGADLNIRNTENGDIRLTTADTERMRITHTGLVGVGTSSPSAKLDVWGNLVVGASSISTLFVNTATNKVGIATTSLNAQSALTVAGTIFTRDPGNGRTFSIDAGNASIDGSGGTHINRFTSSIVTLAQGGGNVGIGTSSPYAKLSISTFNGGSTPLFAIASSTGSGATSTAFIVNHLGNVGIATTSPWRTLSVNGTVGFDGLTGATGAGSLCLSASNEVVYNSGSHACLPSLRSTKHDISPLTLDALGQVLALQPVSFIYNEGDGRTRYGFIAEDTASVDEHLATYDAEGEISGIDDRALLSIVVKAIQSLAATLGDFAQSFTSNEVHATNLLCIGATCINESQLQGMLAASSVASQPPPPPPSSQSAANDNTSPPTTPTTTASSTPATANDNTPPPPDEDASQGEAAAVADDPEPEDSEEVGPPAPDPASASPTTEAI